VGIPIADGALAYAGAVPFGFSARRVVEEFTGMVTAESPFRGVDRTRRVVYVRPEVEVLVQYQTTTAQGHLRNACIRREPVDL